MCVIAFVQKDEQRLTEEMIDKMWAVNSSGVGVSWRETTPEGPVIRWRKGLTLADIKEVATELPLPHIIHFRNPSQGTSTAPTACHPFPLEPTVPMDLEGISLSGVLFHNGFWTGWKDKLINWALLGGFILPSGGWSDSRGLAWAAANLGNGILDLIDEKVIIMTPTDIESFGSGWTEMANGLFVSNLHWQNPPKASTQYYHGQIPASLSGGSKETKADASGTKGEDRGFFPYQGSFCVPGFNPALPLRSDAERKTQQDTVQKAGEGVVSDAVKTAQQELDWALGVSRGTICEDCRKAPGHVLYLNVRRCWSCYDLYQRKQKTKEHGTCEFCGKLPTTYLTTAEAKWMCHGCWRQHGKPEIVRDEDLRPDDQKAIQARRAGGTL